MFSSGIPEQAMRIVSNNNQSPVDGKQKGSGKSQLEKGLCASKVKRRSDVIQIRSTDKILKRVRYRFICFMGLLKDLNSLESIDN